jgi:hypothetical protein
MSTQQQAAPQGIGERSGDRLPRMAEKKPERQFSVGQHIEIKLSGGQIEPGSH